MNKIKNKLFALSLLLIIFSAGANFVLAQEKSLENQYPEVPGVETAEMPTTVRTTLPQYVKYIFNFGLWVAVAVASISLFYGGVRYLTSGGSASAALDARKQIFAGLLGLVILFSAYAILNTINPQLLFLKKIDLPGLPEIPIPVPLPGLSEKQTLSATEIPIAAMINGANYSEHKGILDERRLALLKEITDEVKRVSFKIADDSQKLIPLASECSAENTLCTDPASDASCVCEGEPCPNRRTIDTLRFKINALNSALDVFIKSGKVRSFINNFPSAELLEKSLGAGYAEKTRCYEVGAMACSKSGDPTCYPGIFKNCLTSALQIDGPLLSDDLKKDLEKMAQIEERGGELEQIRQEMEKDLQLLGEAEKIMKECAGVRENRKPYDLLPASEFSNYKEDLIWDSKLVKEIKTERAWPEVTAIDDPGTFYCTEGLNELPFISGEEITEENIEQELEKIGQDQLPQKITCSIEIPLGKTIDDAVSLAKKIMGAIAELLSYAEFQIESAYQMTVVTDWNSCSRSWVVNMPLGGNMRGCPAAECYATRDAGKPCPPTQTCQIEDINAALSGLESNIACLLKKKGDTGIELEEKSLTCCSGLYTEDCEAREGAYGRLLSYYEESVKINKQLTEDRAGLSACQNTAEERGRILRGEKVLEKGVSSCLTAKTACGNLNENYECYGESDPKAHSNYWCIESETQ